MSELKRQFLSSLISIAFLSSYVGLGYLYSDRQNSPSLDVSGKASWVKTHNIILKAELTIGTDDFEKENYIFGIIRDIEIDDQGQIYVLDGKNYRIQKYSREGIFLLTIGKGKGQGPGEFQRPMKMALGPDNTLYVIDQDKGELIIFSRSGDFVTSVPIEAHGADIVVARDGDFFITKYFNTGESSISWYELKTKKIKQTFGRNTKEYSLSGMASYLAVDPEGNIYCSSFYPYEIDKFSPNGKELSKFSRKAKFQTPYRNERGSWSIPSSSLALAAFPDGKILNVIRHVTRKNQGIRASFEFDIFDPGGRWLFSFPPAQLETNWIRIVNIDREGKLYLDYMDPYPHIKRFSMDLVSR